MNNAFSVHYVLVFVLSIVAVFVMSCDGPTEPNYDFYVPKYLSLQDLRNGVQVLPPQQPLRLGKLLANKNYVYVVDSANGIHVYNCQNPDASTPIAFIAIPGAKRFVIADDVLYADSYIDLLTFDISTPSQPTLKSRIENIFPQLLSPVYESVNLDSGVVTGWVHVKGDLMTYKDNKAIVEMPDGEREMRVEVSDPNFFMAGLRPKEFEVVGHYLYVGLQNELRILDIKVKWSPAEWSRVTVGWTVSNMFVHADELYVGTEYDVYLYDIADPTNPTKHSMRFYATSCNQLAARDTIVYVAERGTAGCNSFWNVLHVYDITDARIRLNDVPLTEPFSIEVEGDRLYVCDGIGGLKVYDVTTPSSPVFSGSYPVGDCRNIALLGTTAVVTTTDGLHVLDCTNPAAISELSSQRVVL